MNILIIGGTKFLGRALVEAALARGHEVTLFNRGQSEPDAFADSAGRVEQIHGDRNSDLHRLNGRTWDAAIDTCGYTSSAVRASAEALADKVEHYTFISTMSVYASQATPNADESAALAQLAEGQEEGNGYETYGESKALAEAAAERAMPGRVLHVRAGLLIGPNDYVERFPYWVQRVARASDDQGEVLVPDAFERPLQTIDVRDVAAWVLDGIVAGRTGAFNVTGHVSTLGHLFETLLEVTDRRATLVPVDEAFLLERDVAPFADLPLWLPPGDEYAGFMTRSVDRAFDAGLDERPLAASARDVLAWDAARRESGAVTDFPREAMGTKMGLTPQRERALIDAWRAHQADAGS